MCRIKTGENITQIHDVQNLITAYILRSSNPFTIKKISEKVAHSCEGSKLNISDSQIRDMVKQTTIALLRARYITANAGNYYAQPAKFENT